jgi:hypothetical protein
MRRSLLAVLGSIVLTMSMVAVWPVGVERLGPRQGIWSGAGTALADVTMETRDGECVVSEVPDEPRLYVCVDPEFPDEDWYRYWDGREWVGPLYSAGDWWVTYFAAGRLNLEMVRAITLYLGGGFNAMFLAVVVLLILTPAISTLERLGLPADPEEVETEETGVAAPPPAPSPSPSAQSDPVHPAGGPPGSRAQCDVSSFGATPTVTVKDVGSTATPALARADFWVHEDCSVRMELLWQAELYEDLCYILVAASTGTSTERGVTPQVITGHLDAGTTLIDWACPAIDCRGKLDWLFDCDKRTKNKEVIDAKTECPRGQLGPFLSSARAEVAGTVVEDGTLYVEPLTFQNRFTFEVGAMFAEPQDPPPEGDCPARKAARPSTAPE